MEIQFRKKTENQKEWTDQKYQKLPLIFQHLIPWNNYRTEKLNSNRLWIFLEISTINTINIIKMVHEWWIKVRIKNKDNKTERHELIRNGYLKSWSVPLVYQTSDERF